MQNSNLLKLSINDLFSIKMMQYSLAPLIISMGILYLLFFLFAGATLDQLSTLL
ncbi:MAG: hypothetical protein U9P38_07055 [Campylobacterota bacterium]|nr:hypothetical protein [Campylobacterota bacterium]